MESFKGSLKSCKICNYENKKRSFIWNLAVEDKGLVEIISVFCASWYSPPEIGRNDLCSAFLDVKLLGNIYQL